MLWNLPGRSKSVPDGYQGTHCVVATVSLVVDRASWVLLCSARVSYLVVRTLLCSCQGSCWDISWFMSARQNCNQNVSSKSRSTPLPLQTT